MQRCYGRHIVPEISVNHSLFINFISGVISLPDVTSYDKCWLVYGILEFITHAHYSLILAHIYVSGRAGSLSFDMSSNLHPFN